MLFRSDEHKRMFEEFFLRMTVKDSYHEALAYLLALNNDLLGERSENKFFNFVQDEIKLDAIENGLSGSSRRIITLAFNLWNDSNNADVSEVFGYMSDNAEYLFEAIRIRFRVRK